MPKRIVPITDPKVKNAKPQAKEYKIFDGGGLYLLVTPTGGKLWRMKYRVGGKEKLLSLGAYPEISLEKARTKRLEARKLIGEGLDPSADRKATKAANTERQGNTFEVVAREWHEQQKADNAWIPDHAATIMTRLEKDVFPWMGSKPITEVTAKDIRSILDRVRSRGVIETARRVRTICSQVFTYAISMDKALYDVAASLKKYLPPTTKTRKHMAAVTNPKELGPILRAIDGYQGEFPTQCALKILPMVFVRPGELRHMEWTEIDLDVEEWNIPGAKMKMKQPHLVPLPRQVVEILKELRPLTGAGRYVFPSIRSAARPMSDNTINAAFRRMGIDGETLVGHGFRATARTILDEILGFRVDFIEHQLAHAVKDPNGRAYNRTAHLAERLKMMQTWADYLDGLKSGAKVIPLHRKAEGT